MQLTIRQLFGEIFSRNNILLFLTAHNYKGRWEKVNVIYKRNEIALWVNHGSLWQKIIGGLYTHNFRQPSLFRCESSGGCRWWLHLFETGGSDENTIDEMHVTIQRRRRKLITLCLRGRTLMSINIWLYVYEIFR